jgi:uncharacterized protein (DUF58 family)
VFAGTLRAERRSRRTGASLEFADYRNYAPGDDPRRIDWNIYGRLGRLMTKLTEEEEDLRVALLIDCSASMRWKPQGAERIAKFDLARRLAAALGYLALHGMDHLNLEFFDSSLRAAPAPGGPTDLAGCLDRFARRQRQRGLALVFTDGLDPAGPERGLEALVARHWDLHLLHVMDPSECDPAERGDLFLSDCEGGGTLPVTAGPGLLRAYREEVQRFQTGVKTWCARHRAGYSLILTDANFDDVVLRLFRREGLVR